MSQVTIYLDPATLEAAKAAAARAHVSVSKWFSQFAEAEKAKAENDWQTLFDTIDALKQPGDDTDLDFLLDTKTRYAGLGQDVPRESMDD